MTVAMPPASTALLRHWAVVTGGSKGIGLGIARQLVGAGASVVLVARNAEGLAKAKAELEFDAHHEQTVLTAECDTGDRESISALFARLRDELPHLNVFVANAGHGVITPFLDIAPEEWDRTVALNLTGTFACCQSAARMMIENPEAAPPNQAILVVSSIRADGVRPGRAAYAASKAGINQLVRVAAHELAPHGIRVNLLSPGITATPLALEENPTVFAEMSASVPMGRAGTPDDMGAAALYLCSPHAAFVTGADLVVDGGESLW